MSEEIPVEVRILRGLPGAGKTRYCLKTWASGGTMVQSCSADDFFTNSADGSYHFDPARIGEAHRECFRRFSEFVRSSHWTSKRVIIVDNTNIHAWEIAPYAMEAAAHAIPFRIITFWVDTPAHIGIRNVHQVPLEVILAMHQDLLREKLPSFWPHTVIPVVF